MLIRNIIKLYKDFEDTTMQGKVEWFFWIYLGMESARVVKSILNLQENKVHG